MSCLKRFFFVLVLITLFGDSDFMVKGQNEEKQQTLKIVINSSGWQVPDGLEAELISVNKTSYKEVEVEQSTYNVKKPNEHVINLYILKERDKLVQLKKHVELASFSVLAVKGKRFAYIMNFQQFGISEVAGRAYFGAPIKIVVSDDDGDGIFETRRYYPFGDFDQYPDWILK